MDHVSATTIDWDKEEQWHCQRLKRSQQNRLDRNHVNSVETRNTVTATKNQMNNVQYALAMYEWIAVRHAQLVEPGGARQ